MSKITSKLQLTLPKVLADEFGLRPGDEVTWQAAGESIRVIPSRATQNALDAKARLKLFDAATARQKRRKRQPIARKREWSREELYDRGLSR